MAYTFGAATADDITVTASHNCGSSGGVSLWAGWFYPTTLTATRGYFSAGNVWGCEVDTTTSDLRFRTDNTTDGQYTAAGCGITTNKWWFIAVFATQHTTGPAGEFRVWVGDQLGLSPITATVATAPVGAVGGNSGRTIGNKGTGTLAFQGDIGWVSVVTMSATSPALPTSASGAIDDAGAGLVHDIFVRPLWLGRPHKIFAACAAYSNSFSVLHFPLNTSGVCYEWSHDQAQAPIKALTINGATYTQNFPPLSPPENWPHMLPVVRRAA